MQNLTNEETNTILSFFNSPMRVNNIKSFTAPHLSSKANAVCHFCDDTGSITDDEHNKWPCPSCLHGTLKNVLHDNRQWAEHGDRFVRARTPDFIEALTTPTRCSPQPFWPSLPMFLLTMKGTSKANSCVLKRALTPKRSGTGWKRIFRRSLLPKRWGWTPSPTKRSLCYQTICSNPPI